MDSISTAFEYISGNSKTDCAVARVLSGWPTPTRGASAPSLADIVDLDAQNTIKHLSASLFIHHPIQAELRDVLFAVQLYHLKSVAEASPAHLLVSRIVSHASTSGVSLESLLQYGAEIREGFNSRNALDISKDDLSASLRTDLAATKEVMGKVVADMADVKLQLARQNVLLEDILRKLDAAAPAVTQLAAPTDISLVAAAPNDDAPITIFPADLRSLAKVSMASAFYRYVVDDLVNCQPQDKTEKSSWEILKENFDHMMSMNARTLPPRPADQHSAEFLTWTGSIHAIAAQCESSSLAVLRAIHPPGPRKREITNAVSANVKRMRTHLRPAGPIRRRRA
jgi:hypothetical protein